MSHLEVESLAEFDARAAAGRLARCFVQSVDLTGRDDALAAADLTGTVLLGCRLTPAGADLARAGGALVFPEMPDSPVNPYRAGLYTARELYDAPAYADSLDGRVYAWYRAGGRPPELGHTLVQALHDHAISDALDEDASGLDPARVVGLMGGHAAERGSAAYADTARLGARLAAGGFTVATGGGPGAMEAANLGAYLAADPDALERALVDLAAVPSFRPSIDAWAAAALAVLDRHPDGGASLGIPTWFYGHEPPNVFATRIAKYFSNAQREDTLLARCRGGIVYLPGAAGTVQELFQAVTAGYYAADPAGIAPLVLVGVEQWTRTLPAWPLLSALAASRPMAARIALVDTVAEAWDWLLAGGRGPTPYAG